jgi:hypothetical protein
MIAVGSTKGLARFTYWQPVCTSEELSDLPRRVKLLCEELVIFRDKKGRVGALGPTLWPQPVGWVASSHRYGHSPASGRSRKA